MAKKEINAALVTAIAASLVGTDNITSEGDVFNKNLPESITPEMVDELAGYTTDFVAAGLDACGAAAIVAMKKDKKLNDVQATLGMGALGDVSYGINRERKVTPPGGEEQTSYGINRTVVKFSPGESNATLKLAKEAIKTAAKAAFSK